MAVLLRSALFALVVALVAASPAAAGPVATSDAQFQTLGGVFPDPQGGPCSGACSPTRRGNVRATQFVGWSEFVNGIRYMNTSAAHPEWQRYMEILPLDGKLDAPEATGAQTSGTGPTKDMAAGNNLPFAEWDPKPEYISSGLPRTDGGLTGERIESDLVVVRVTDETVPDAGKKRYALSLSIHGIERAGAEGGIRAMEDLVTAHTENAGRADAKTLADVPIVPKEVKENAPTFADVLKKTIIYFTFPNPDGWRRGSVTEAGLFFQRYNGNGVDLNRDWPGIGYSFRGYSALSEPESWAFANFFLQTKEKGGPFTLGDDLHGQPFADALSYTLLPQGRRDFAKDLRIRKAAERINRGTYHAIKWNPFIQDNDQPPGNCADTPVGPPCDKIYAQTWGTVYDTINYTTSGTLGDWFDQAVGLGAEGIDNEMSFSHLDKNIVFDNSDPRNTEQLHVDGNSSLIYSRIVDMLDPPTGSFDAPGRKGFVPNKRVSRDRREASERAPAGTKAQDTETSTPITPANPYEFTVQRTPEIYNGGMRVTATAVNLAGIGPGGAGSIANIPGLSIECRFCDDHPGVDENAEEDEWVVVAQDFNQSPAYAQAGFVAVVNRPDPVNRNGKPVEWRARISPDVAEAVIKVEFFSRPVSTSGEFSDPSSVTPAGGEAPFLNGYDVANTDFFRDLNPFIPGERNDFNEIRPGDVIANRQSLAPLTSLVLADDPLPGYTGPYGPLRAGGKQKAAIDIERDTTSDAGPGAYGTVADARPPGTYTEIDFAIPEEERSKALKVRIDWTNKANDWDMYLYRIVDEEEVPVGESTGTQLETNFEEINLENPPPGDYRLYVDNYASADASDSWAGKITFEPAPAEQAGDTGAYSVAEKDAWMEKLREYVRGGGNLVITDGALRALPDLAGIPRDSIEQVDVYAGQVAFGKDDDTSTKDDPLATKPMNIQQLGSRDNGQRRRQMFEPTPLGFYVDPGRSEVGARQWHVVREDFEKAGGRVVGTSASPDVSAEAIYDRVTLGEIKQGNGQIRALGALLPQPQTTLDHEYGVEPYATTYSGYIMMRNLLEAPDRPDPTIIADPPGGEVPAACRAGGGFKSASAKGRRRGVRVRFARKVNRRVNVDVFQQSSGRRIVGERLIARFRNKARSFTWNGKANRRGRRVVDGYYVVRYTMRIPGETDVRRVVMRRVRGKFTRQRNYYRRASCGLLRAFKLTRPVFGGRTNRAQGISFRVLRRARVKVTVYRGVKGKRVVRRYRTTTRAANRTHRLRLPAKALRRGDYRVVLSAVAGSRRVTAKLYGRRL